MLKRMINRKRKMNQKKSEGSIMLLSIILERDEDKAYQNIVDRLGHESLNVDGIDIEWVYHDGVNTDEVELISLAKEKATGDHILIARATDKFSEGFIGELKSSLDECPDVKIFLPKNKAAFRVGMIEKINLDESFTVFPYYVTGNVFEAGLFKGTELDDNDRINGSIRFVFDMCLKEMVIYRLPNATYKTEYVYESGDHFYKAIYEKDWYNKSFEDFYLPYLKSIKETRGEVPKFIQIFMVYALQCRLEANRNNKNKHVIEPDEATKLLETAGECFRYIDDDILFSYEKCKDIVSSQSVKWVYGILKYGKDFKFETYKDDEGVLCFGTKDRAFATVAGLAANLVFMEYINGKLEFDGTIHPVLYSLADEIYISYAKDKYPLVYNGRYSLTKSMGVSLYKSHSFHVSIDLKDVDKAHLALYAKLGDDVLKIDLRYESHFSRISDRYKNSYWFFKKDSEYRLVTHDDGKLLFSKAEKKDRRKQERKLQREMLAAHGKKDLLFLGIRQSYFKMKPIMKKKPIWMYIDKIYKGGDSSEYLYRYASKQGDNIDHYYLIDKDTSDYRNLVADGFKPLVRGTVKHRLLFLMADMMVISNSTVMSFNNYGLINSSYVRDLINFHVCCVQHGMSVQKIAVAQNRLRDNTRLYFCASKYEIENLSKPIYDYVGYEPEALKLTGVPRYDGLVDEEKKQIMISPTWRMQAAVPIAKTNKSESTQREYNPLFKESTYYKVFNALINDKRLIDAAKQYGYRIKYVLHPIVSSQVDDFDRNEYTDIIPAVGDMSYEKMFRESSLMVTDFSGIQFDFAYMRKPLVYLHHKDIPQHYEEGTFFYDTMAFGEITHDNDELIDVLIDYMKNGCKMKDEYVKRADDFFYFNDHENCKRIYKEMIDYQEKYILPNII